jgi:hypothetical protein
MFRVLGIYLDEISINFNTQPIRDLPSLGMITY